jgi:hypothetical protein
MDEDSELAQALNDTGIYFFESPFSALKNGLEPGDFCF